MKLKNIEKGQESIMNEINIMRNLNHQNVINLHRIYDNPNYLFLVIDLAKGGNLN